MNTSSDIYSLIVSTRDRDTLIDVIDRIEGGIYRQDSAFSFKSVIDETDNPELADEIVDRVMKEKDKQILLTEIKAKLKLMRLLRLELSTYPTGQMLKKIGLWVKKNVGEDVIVDWSVERNIVSGTKISFEGKYGDFSLRAQLDKWWDEKGKQVLKEVGL